MFSLRTWRLGGKNLVRLIFLDFGVQVLQFFRGRFHRQPFHFRDLVVNVEKNGPQLFRGKFLLRHEILQKQLKADAAFVKINALDAGQVLAHE